MKTQNPYAYEITVSIAPSASAPFREWRRETFVANATPSREPGQWTLELDAATIAKRFGIKEDCVKGWSTKAI